MRQKLSLTISLFVVSLAAVALAEDPPQTPQAGALVPPPMDRPQAQGRAKGKQDAGGVRVVRYSGKKITRRAAQVPGFAEPVGWSAKRQGKGAITTSAVFGVGDEEGAS
jgi:hypothetical protein